ncbi:PQQ-like beta-propeller repeat protein [bacterium]|nr:PQQ-like beta-propeller repeat protein [bacterium]
MKLKHSILFVILMTSLISISAFAEDWTKWRGPNANGISTEKNWNPEALKKPKILWKAEVGRGSSAISIKGNLCYTMGEREETSSSDTTYFEIVHCLDSKTGRTVWTHEYKALLKQWRGPFATPVIDGKNVYTIGRQGMVFCFDAKDGKIIWQLNMIEADLTKHPEWGFAGSVLIEDDIAFINAGKSGLALNKKNGTIIWKSEALAPGLATPVLWEHDGVKEIVINGNKIIHSVEPETGKVLWTKEWFSYTDPDFTGDRFFNSTGQDGLGLFQIHDSHLHTVWHNKRLSSYTWNHFVKIADYLYGFARIQRDWHLHCLNYNTGEVQWTEPTIMFGALLGAGDKIIMIEGEGNLKVIEANSNQYTLVSQTEIFKLGNWQKYPRSQPNTCWTMPVLANGKLYIRTTYGQLTCIDMK